MAIEFPMLLPHPLQAASEARVHLSRVCPAINKVPILIDSGIFDQAGLSLAFRDLAVELIPEWKGGFDPVMGALWSSEGRIVIEKCIEPAANPHRSRDYRWISARLLGHWLMHGERLGEYADFPLDTEPTIAPTLCISLSPPVTVFERLAASFALAFLIPEDQLKLQIRHLGLTLSGFRVWPAGRGSLTHLGDIFDVEPWLVEQRINELFARLSSSEKQTIVI